MRVPGWVVVTIAAMWVLTGVRHIGGEDVSSDPASGAILLCLAWFILAFTRVGYGETVRSR
jgi:hypothetical protein